MKRETERGTGELCRDDAGAADALPLDRGRRGFLSGTGLAAIGAVIGGGMPFERSGPIPAASAQGAAPAPKGPQYLKFPGKNEGLVVLGDRPLVAETPESLLDDDTTPTEKFYIRNNGQIPDPAKDPEAWKIVIDGEVNKPLELSLGELKSKYKAVTRRMVLECGGNGRSGFSPPARGNQWTNGGAGCAEWTGVALADVQGRRLEAEREIHRALFGRPASLRQCRDAEPLARRAHREGARSLHDDRVGDERAAAAEHPRRAGAPGGAGLAGLGLAEVAHPHHAARQGA
jgi:hypothetical protein